MRAHTITFAVLIAAGTAHPAPPRSIIPSLPEPKPRTHLPSVPISGGVVRGVVEAVTPGTAARVAGEVEGIIGNLDDLRGLPGIRGNFDPEIKAIEGQIGRTGRQLPTVLRDPNLPSRFDPPGWNININPNDPPIAAIEEWAHALQVAENRLLTPLGQLVDERGLVTRNLSEVIEQMRQRQSQLNADRRGLVEQYSGHPDITYRGSVEIDNSKRWLAADLARYRQITSELSDLSDRAHNINRSLDLDVFAYMMASAPLSVEEIRQLLGNNHDRQIELIAILNDPLRRDALLQWLQQGVQTKPATFRALAEELAAGLEVVPEALAKLTR